MFFIIRPSLKSEHQHSASGQPKSSLTSPQAQIKPSTKFEDVEGQTTRHDREPFGDDGTESSRARRRSIEHSKEPPPRIRKNNNNDMIIQIGNCIKALKTEKDVLKAENAQLTQDIRRMDALRAQQATLKAEMTELVENIHARHMRIQGPHRLALKKAKAVRKLASEAEEETWAELRMTEGMLDPFVEVDEDEKVVLKDKYREDVEKEGLFDAYTEAKSSFDGLNAAMSRLRQARTELQDLAVFVSKVEHIAIRDIDGSSDRFDPLSV